MWFQAWLLNGWTQESREALTDTIPVMEWQIILGERNKEEMHKVSICPKNGKKNNWGCVWNHGIRSLSPKWVDFELLSAKDKSLLKILFHK